MKDIQEKLLGLMIELDNICAKHNLRYYIIGGTLLGAVRHKGFIPWDDDVDIGLPREDYEKFLCLSKDSFPEHIHLKTPYNTEDLLFPYSKFIDKNTTLIEDRLDGIVEGVYIDIFPLDGVGDTNIDSKIHFWKTYILQSLLYNNQDIGIKNGVKRIWQWVSRKLDRDNIYKLVSKNLIKRKFNDSKYVANMVGAWKTKEIMPRDFFGKPTYYEFENKTFFGPEDYDSFLKNVYGDYMQLPPIEKQESHHNFKYINLNMPYKDYRRNN